MKEDSKDKIQIFLIGGNSVIGEAILNGVLEKYKNNNIEIISFIRTNYGKKIQGETVFVDEYIESVKYIDKNFSSLQSKKIIILSFGVLIEEKNSNTLSENLKYHLNINTFDTFNIYRLLANSKTLLEIHVVSSILGDFIRPSLYSYSISKNFLELLIDNLEITKKIEEKVFIWKPSFVVSRLNMNRKSTFLKTNPKKIRKIVTKKNNGGKYYIPKVAIIFTFIARFTSPLIKWLDNKI